MAKKSSPKKTVSKKTTANKKATPVKKKNVVRATTQSTDMNTSEIRDLIDFISKTGLNEVNVETKELKLHVKRDPDQQIQSSAPVQLPAAAPAPQPVMPAAPAVQPAAEKAPTEAEAGKYLEIKSPMIGTFYRSPNPDSPAFVSVGDKVTKGQTVCIIEAMKLFNEIESEIAGTIVKVMAENSTPVEYDQVLYLVEPD